MSITVDAYSIPKIEGGVSGAAALDMLNAPVEAIETALNALSARIGNLNSKSAVVRQYVPLSDDVAPGTLVYYDVVEAKFMPAIARLLSTPGSQGESVEAPESRAEGLVVSLDAGGGTGTLLCSGYWESAAVAQACLGSEALAGTYYLSPLVAGKAVLDTGGHLRQAILSYYGDGKLNLSVFYLAHDNHFHGSAVLTGSWVAADEAANEFNDPTLDVPTGATFVYNRNADATVLSMGELSEATTAVFYEGVLQPTGSDFIVHAGHIWYVGEDSPVEGTVTVFNHFPFAYNSPVIRGVESTAASLRVRNKNGLVSLTPSNYISGATSKNALAVSALSGNTILFTPVVTGIKAGPGITVARTGDGTCTLASSSTVNSPVDAYSVNHNGTAVTSDGFYQYFTYPKSREASMVISMPVRGLGEGTLSAYVWGTCIKGGASFSVTARFVPQPVASGDINLSEIADVDASLQFANSTSASMCVYSETTDAVPVLSDGMLYAAIKITAAPATDVRLMRVGFILRVAAATPTPVPGDIVSMSAVTGTFTAGYGATQYDLLMSSGTALQLCRSTEVGTLNRCIGIALHTCENGEPLEYVMSGIIQDPTFSFTPGDPVYVGTNGRLLQGDPEAPPTATYVQKVGMALTSAAVQISIETAVLKD